MGRISISALVPALVLTLGCEPDNEAPRTFIAGPRVLAIIAEPPEVAPGGSSTVTAMVVGTSLTPVVSWSRCRLAPLPGQATNPDCITNPGAAYIEPIGEGTTIVATMPADVTADSLGEPDASGGVYLTLIANVTVGAESFSGVYRLRLGQPTGGNQNPIQNGVFVVDVGGLVPLDEATPRVVHVGDRLKLAVTLAAGSVQTYVSPLAQSPGGQVAEVLRTAWFSTAGDFSSDRTTVEEPDTVLVLDEFLPPIGSTIDLYAVTRDERGGTDFAHRTLQLE